MLQREATRARLPDGTGHSSAALHRPVGATRNLVAPFKLALTVGHQSNDARLRTRSQGSIRGVSKARPNISSSAVEHAPRSCRPCLDSAARPKHHSSASEHNTYIMSQLASAAKPARTARQLKNIRETRKVKGAIRWHERQRERRQKIAQERHDDKQVFQQIRQWHTENVSRPINEARKNLKQDYELGPLRPNRAVGQDAEKYGLLGVEQLTRKAIPVETQKRVNEAREARGLDPVYPLVVKDQKYFPIVRDDRVMVIKGPEKGKIGVVQDVMSGTHEVVVKGINKVGYFVLKRFKLDLTRSSSASPMPASSPPKKTRSKTSGVRSKSQF